MEYLYTKNGSYRYKSKYYKPSKFLRPTKQILDNKLELLNKLSSPQDLDNLIQAYDNEINQVCNTAFKKRPIFKKLTNLNWWSPELATERNKVTALHRRYISLPTPENKSKLNKHKALYRRHIKLAKRSSWKHFCHSQTDPFGTPFKLIRDKNLKFNDLIHTSLEGMLLNTNKLDIQEYLTNHHFPSPNNNFEPYPLKSTPQSTQASNPPIFPPIITVEIDQAIKEQNLNKAPGFDRIDGQIFVRIYNTN